MKRAMSIFVIVALCFLYTLAAQGQASISALEPRPLYGAYGDYDDGYFDDFFGDDNWDWFGGFEPEYDPPGMPHRSFQEGSPEELDVVANGVKLRGRALAGRDAYLIPLFELAGTFWFSLSGYMEPTYPGGIIPLNVMIIHHSDPERMALLIGNVEEGMPAQCDLYRADGRVQTAEVMVLNGEIYLCAQCAAFAMSIECDMDSDFGAIHFWDGGAPQPREAPRPQAEDENDVMFI